MKELLFAAFFLASGSAHALGTLNCSNADGSVRRVEKETWGANRVSLVINGTTYAESELRVQYNEASETRLDSSKSAAGGEEVYGIKLRVSRKDAKPFYRDLKTVNTWVICRHWWNKAID